MKMYDKYCMRQQNPAFIYLPHLVLIYKWYLRQGERGAKKRQGLRTNAEVLRCSLRRDSLEVQKPCEQGNASKVIVSNKQVTSEVRAIIRESLHNSIILGTTSGAVPTKLSITIQPLYSPLYRLTTIRDLRS